MVKVLIALGVMLMRFILSKPVLVQIVCTLPPW